MGVRAPTEIPDSDAAPAGAADAERIAWHALDHAWEIEDRSEPAG